MIIEKGSQTSEQHGAELIFKIKNFSLACLMELKAGLKDLSDHRKPKLSVLNCSVELSL